MPSQLSADTANGSGPPSDFDRRVYQAIAAYAWDEAECHPSQWTVARDIGCSREAVNRSVRRLIAAGWLAIVERRWSPRSHWSHNVYELYEQFVVGALTIKRIVRRAHKRPNRWADWEAGTARSGLDHTNAKRSTALECSCNWCKAETPLSVGRRERGAVLVARREREAQRDIGQRISEGLARLHVAPSEHRRFVKLWHVSEQWREAEWSAEHGMRAEFVPRDEATARWTMVWVRPERVDV